jgi:endonuclease YncB( thermonuclease family)
MLTSVISEPYHLIEQVNKVCDSIHGFAVKILDSDTFQMRVTWMSPKNQYLYQAQETIRISSIDAPELYHPSESRDREDMEWKFRGKIVKCNVKDRISDGKLVCTIVGAF